MKTKIVTVILCFLTLNINAQLSFSVNAGPNLGGVITKNNGKKDAAIKLATGYTFAGDVNIPLNNSWIFQTGLQYENLHSKVNTNSTTSGGGFTIKETFTGKSFLNYINIPVKLFYTIPAGNGSFMIGAGPYLGIAISGKSSSTDITETTVGSNTTRSQYDYSEKATFGSADTAIKRTNVGAGLNLSYRMVNNLIFSAYTNIGVTNINNENNRTTKTMTYGITIGYVFGKTE